MVLSPRSERKSLSFCLRTPARLSRYQKVLLFEKGTPRRKEPWCGLIPTNRILGLSEVLYRIILPEFVFPNHASEAHSKLLGKRSQKQKQKEESAARNELEQPKRINAAGKALHVPRVKPKERLHCLSNRL